MPEIRPILLAEDNANDVELTMSALQAHNVANSVVKVDGLEVLRHVKADPHLRRMPVVVLTSSREESDLVRSYDLGVNAYVVKPMNFPDFIQAVETLGAFWALLNELPHHVLGRRPRVARGQRPDQQPVARRANRRHRRAPCE
jgi:response regulator RpfG family c-di-GMP phosphodiesterase